MTKDLLAIEIRELMDCAADAYIQYNFADIGGCAPLDLDTFPLKYRKHIHDYLFTDKLVTDCVADYIRANYILAPK